MPQRHQNIYGLPLLTTNNLVMARIRNSKSNVTHVILGALISTILLLTTILDKQDLYALTPVDRYNSGFSHGKQQALSDFQSNSTFNPVCNQHTNYYCAGYFNGYNVTWNSLTAKGQTSNPGPTSISTNPVLPVPNTKTTAASSSISSSDSLVTPLIIFVIIVIIIIATARKLKHKSGKYKERQRFSDSIKEKVLEKQHHRCADCNRVLNVVDWHHRNDDRSDNKESNCVALCPNCHAIKTRRHQ
jgi:hypothetical protein